MGLKPAEKDTQIAVVDMRLVKDRHELVAMRSAAFVTAHMPTAATALGRWDRYWTRHHLTQVATLPPKIAAWSGQIDTTAVPEAGV